VRDTALAACMGESPVYEVELIRRTQDLEYNKYSFIGLLFYLIITLIIIPAIN